MKRFTYDPVTAALEEYGRSHGPAISEEIARELVHAQPATRSRVCVEAMTAIASRHDQFTLLILSRKIPESFLSGICAFDADTPEVRHSRYSQAVVTASNYILHYAPTRRPVESVLKSRNDLRPSDSELDDALRLTLYAYQHRQEIYKANTLARAPLGTPDTLPALLNSYNRRLSRPRLPLALNSGPDRVCILVSISTLPPIAHTKWMVSPSGTRLFGVRLVNFAPIPFDHSEVRESLAYQDTDEFASIFGMRWSKFWDCWVGLNEVLLQSLPMQWLPATEIPISDDALMGLERLFDICETGLGGGPREKIVARLIEVLASRSSECTRDDAQQFLQAVTWRRGVSTALEFAEQPWFLVSLGNVVLWDYVRHGGFVNAVSRAASTNARIRQRKGASFEAAVTSALRTVRGIQQMAANVRFSAATAKGEIDVVAQFGDTVLIIESKANGKPPRYFEPDPVIVSERIQFVERTLRRQDERVETFATQIKSRWPTATKALGIVCTEQVEFLASIAPTYWLQRFDVPRACTVPELSTYLASTAPEGLRSHVAAVQL